MVRRYLPHHVTGQLQQMSRGFIREACLNLVELMMKQQKFLSLLRYLNTIAVFSN